MPKVYDSTRDFILVRRKSGETVLVPPDESMMIPCEYPDLQEAHTAARRVVDGGAGAVWLFEHEHPAALHAIHPVTS